jgi:hypothetical protein
MNNMNWIIWIWISSIFIFAIFMNTSEYMNISYNESAYIILQPYYRMIGTEIYAFSRVLYRPRLFNFLSSRSRSPPPLLQPYYLITPHYVADMKTWQIHDRPHYYITGASYCKLDGIIDTSDKLHQAAGAITSESYWARLIANTSDSPRRQHHWYSSAGKGNKRKHCPRKGVRLNPGLYPCCQSELALVTISRWHHHSSQWFVSVVYFYCFYCFIYGTSHLLEFSLLVFTFSSCVLAHIIWRAQPHLSHYQWLLPRMSWHSALTFLISLCPEWDSVHFYMYLVYSLWGINTASDHVFI